MTGYGHLPYIHYTPYYSIQLLRACGFSISTDSIHVLLKVLFWVSYTDNCMLHHMSFIKINEICMKCAGDQCMYANSLAWSTYVQFPCTHVHLHILGYQFLSVNFISHWQVNAHEAQINAHLLIDQPSLCSVKWAIYGKSLSLQADEPHCL